MKEREREGVGGDMVNKAKKMGIKKEEPKTCILQNCSCAAFRQPWPVVEIISNCSEVQKNGVHFPIVKIISNAFHCIVGKINIQGNFEGHLCE